MKIDLGKLYRNRKALRSLFEKGREDYEKFLLHFPSQKLYFHTSKAVGFLDLPMKNEEGDNHTHLFVDAEKLLHLSKHYRWVSLDNDNVFWSNDDSFVFPSLTDARLMKQIIESPCLGESDRTNEFYLSAEMIDALREANRYVDRLYSQPHYRGVFVDHGKMISVGKALIYERSTGVNSASQGWSKWLSLILLDLDEGSYVQKCKGKENQYRVVNESRSIEFVVKNDTDLKVPQTDSQKFIDSYNHDTKLLFNRETMISTIRFLEGYTQLENNDSLRVTIKPEKKLEMKSNLQGIFSKTIEVDYVDEGLEETEFNVAAEKLKHALTSLESDHVEAWMNPDKPLIKIVGMDEPDTHILLSKIRD